MKKLIYKGLYETTALILSRFNIRSLMKLKLYLGIALLVIVSSCSKNGSEIINDETNGDEVEGPMCYAPPHLQESE